MSAIVAGRASPRRVLESDFRELGARNGRTADLTCDDEAVDGEVSDEEVNIVVVHIRRLARSASLEFALRVGAVIIHHFYGGQVDAWRTRGPKSASFRKLAQHPGLPLSAGALYRSVALYELCDRLRAPSRWEHLGASHLRVVLKLPASAQEQLLTKANAERWTVKTLHEIVLEQKVTNSRGGRRREPPVERGLTSMRRCLEEYRRALEQVGPLSARDVQSSLRLLQETKTFLDELSELLLRTPADAPSDAGATTR